MVQAQGHEEHTILRRGWTTGACATAAAKAACAALISGVFPDPVEITLPRGTKVSFALASHDEPNRGECRASVIKDAGDDPDVTHGALISARVRLLPKGSGLVFCAGPGVGTVTRPGLPIPPGEPAINPVPRRMIAQALGELMESVDAQVTIEIENGEALAQKTLNSRLGIVGGLSVLGTTGIVIPFSCSAWIDSIHRGIDVARAMGITHIAACTGRTSEQAVQALYDLPDAALIEMGDFAGGVLKYLRNHTVGKLTIAGGIAKLSKLAQGRMDLHSGRGSVDMVHLAMLAQQAGADAGIVQQIEKLTTASDAFALAERAGIGIGDVVAAEACRVARGILGNDATGVEIIVFDRTGRIAGRACHVGMPPLKRLT